ncbi:uncharacterized protein A4U43_C07F34640 [Asparagus officinalis]|uniref:C2H2-type domain-containing protein n=1 Tax=Asparagus officinalis TaxID=4686 RepID=A0A5P1EHI4_ASPOF|nr:putative DNA helicase INO80 [Asparagus officinalis]ONK65193.1 uncharacterized protein A4U43_C07F34640 [Asparagus officinalis]
MIKRRFYKRGTHGDDSSDSSDSDSDSDSIPQVEEEEEEEELEEAEEDVTVERERPETKRKRNRRKNHSPSPGSGYESENSSGDEVKVDSSGLLTSDEDRIERGGQNITDGQLMKKANTKETDQEASKVNLNDQIQTDFADCILKCKSVFKCRLCPRIVCLSEDTVKAHLNSKRHARSKKLLDEGRLKLMLNSDGEIEEDQETHAERHLRTVALAQEPVAPVKKDKGRQRQSQRRKKKQLHNSSSKGKSGELTKKPKKKHRKNEV